MVRCYQGTLIRTLDESGREVRNDPDVIQQLTCYQNLVAASTLTDSSIRCGKPRSPSNSQTVEAPLSQTELVATTCQPAGSPTSADAATSNNRAKWSQTEHKELLDAVVSSRRNNRVQWGMVCEKLPHRGLSALRNRYYQHLALHQQKDYASSDYSDDSGPESDGCGAADRYLSDIENETNKQ